MQLLYKISYKMYNMYLKKLSVTQPVQNQKIWSISKSHSVAKKR